MLGDRASTGVRKAKERGMVVSTAPHHPAVITMEAQVPKMEEILKANTEGLTESWMTESLGEV